MERKVMADCYERLRSCSLQLFNSYYCIPRSGLKSSFIQTITIIILYIIIAFATLSYSTANLYSFCCCKSIAVCADGGQDKFLGGATMAVILGRFDHWDDKRDASDLILLGHNVTDKTLEWRSAHEGKVGHAVSPFVC